MIQKEKGSICGICFRQMLPSRMIGRDYNGHPYKKSTNPGAHMSPKSVLSMRLQGLEPWTP